MKNFPTPPQLEWRPGDVPVSTGYDDVYYSADDGLAEARHVFIHGNRLPERLPTHASPWFTVAETGFGTGLNFLALWQWWDALPEPKPNLRYITVDLHPLPVEAIARAHACWPELQAVSEALIRAYPPAMPLLHRRHLAGGRIEIDFLWGEAAERFACYEPEHGTMVDTWFLDGFSPAKNPAMWHENLYRQMARLSGVGTTVATFTAAGHVRRGLTEQGFPMKRAPGFGRKREMLVGERAVCEGAFSRPTSRQPAIVIGAGIAGVGAAWRLARAGRDVLLLEAGGEMCGGASGNPAAAFTPYFTADWSPRGRVMASGFGYMRHLWQWLEAEGFSIRGERCGVLALTTDADRHARVFARCETLGLPPEVMRMVSAAEASDIAGVPLPHAAAYYPQGGWLNMRSFCDALFEHAGTRITFLPHHAVMSLRYEAGSAGSGQWHVYCSGETPALASNCVVLASGAAAKRLVPELGIEPVRGQLLKFTAPAWLQGLRTVVHGESYLTPASDGTMVLGSSFQHHCDDTAVREEETHALLAELGRLFPALDVAALHTQVQPWCGIRCVRPQRLPLVGPVPGYPPGLYTHLAHGSRGSLTGLQPFTTSAY